MKKIIIQKKNLFTEKNQNEQQLNMARHGSKIGSHTKSYPMDKLRKNSLEQSIEETEQQAEEHRNQLPSTHQLNRISSSSNGGNDGSKLTAIRNSYPTLRNSNGEPSNGRTLISGGRLMMISGASLICLTLLLSVFCYFRIRAKQLLTELNGNETNGHNNHRSSIDNSMDSKASLGASQCALGSISATLLQQSNLGNLANGTISSNFNSLFADNLNNLNNLNSDHSFIITGTGALLTTPHTFTDPCTAANLTIYSNQPTTINYDGYAETNQNKL